MKIALFRTKSMYNLSKFWGKFLKNDWKQSCCLIGQMSDDIENDKREENQEWKSLWWWCHLLLLHHISFLLCLYKLSPTAAMNKGRKFKQTNFFDQDYFWTDNYLNYYQDSIRFYSTTEQGWSADDTALVWNATVYAPKP